MGEWSVYIIRCDQRSLYTGISTDVARRVGEHLSGGKKAAKYTRTCSSIALVYEAFIGSRGLAARIEYRIKRLSREKKECIVSSRFNVDELMKFINVEPILKVRRKPCQKS